MLPANPRFPPLTSKERTILLNYVKDNSTVILCKDSRSDMWKQKKAAWIKCADLINSASNSALRTADNVRKCWENIASKSRQNILCHFKKEHNKTGGGIIDSQLSTEDEVVQQIYGEESALFRGENTGIGSMVLIDSPLSHLDAATDECGAESPTGHVTTEDANTSTPTTSKGTSKETKSPIKRKLCAVKTDCEDELGRAKLTCECLRMEREKLIAEAAYLQAATKAQEAKNQFYAAQEIKTRVELALLMKDKCDIQPVTIQLTEAAEDVKGSD